MAKCIIPSCRSNNRELFCSPDDKNKLRKWKQILQVEENSFLVCDVHFADKFVKFEKFLTQDAFPSILLTSEEYSNDDNSDYCQSCLKEFEACSTKVPVNEKIQKIFYKRTSFEIKLHSFLCEICHEKFTDFEIFLSSVKAKHELKMSAGITKIKNEDIDYDECPELYPIQNLEITHHDNDDPEILREVLGRHEIVRQQEIMNSSNNTQSRPPKLQTLRIESGRRTSLLVPKLQEYDDDDDDDTQQGSNSSHPESVNSPMVVIPDFRRRVPASDPLARKIRSKSIHEKKQMSPELNSSIQHDHSFVINKHNLTSKRRNSVASSSADADDLSSKRFRAHHFRDNQGGIPCGYCPAQFSDIGSLKAHLDEVHKASPLKSMDKPENFRCTDCNEGFTSYYYLRKHKDNCEYSLRFKCSQQYCRFRAATVEEINNHMLDAHFSQTRCKICKIDFDSQELYKIHELQEHSSKEKRGRKPKIEVRPDHELKKIILHTESSQDDTKVQCLQCSELISPDMLSIHIKQHLDNESN